MNKIFEMRTSLTVQKNAELLKDMSDEDRQEILELGLTMGVDIVKEGIITSYIICDDLSIEKMKSILKKKEIECEISDVTNQVVSEEKTIDQVAEKDILEKFDINE
jgi:hypothetical protein